MNSEQKRISVKNDYNKIASEYSNEFGQLIEDEELIAEFNKYLHSNTNRILDLGGGTGKIANLMIKNGNDAVCFDFSEEMIKIGKELFPNVSFVLGDIVHLSTYFEKETFDGILAFYSLFHIPKEDLNKVYDMIKETLKQSGLFAFVVQLGDGEQMVDEPYLKEDGKEVLYFNFFDKDNLFNTLKQKGFEILWYKLKSEIGENELGETGNDKLLVLARKL